MVAHNLEEILPQPTVSHRIIRILIIVERLQELFASNWTCCLMKPTKDSIRNRVTFILRCIHFVGLERSNHPHLFGPRTRITEQQQNVSGHVDAGNSRHHWLVDLGNRENRHISCYTHAIPTLPCLPLCLSHTSLTCCIGILRICYRWATNSHSPHPLRHFTNALTLHASHVQQQGCMQFIHPPFLA